MADTLAKLFGSVTRVRLLRLFLFNPQKSFTLKDAAEQSRMPEKEVNHELALFVSINLIFKSTRKRTHHYTLNEEFPYLSAFQNLLIDLSTRGEEIYERIRPAGSMRLVVLCGIFMGEWDAALDLLVVGDRVKEPLLKNGIRTFEAEFGRELKFVSLSTEEFLYRLNMNDRMVRDAFDYPHRIIFDRLQIGLI